MKLMPYPSCCSGEAYCAYFPRGPFSVGTAPHAKGSGAAVKREITLSYSDFLIAITERAGLLKHRLRIIVMPMTVPPLVCARLSSRSAV